MPKQKLKPRALPAFIMKSGTLSILTGIMVGTSYIPLPPWAIFFCYVPLWLAWLDEKSPSRIFWTGWVAQFVLTAIGFNWVAHTVHEFGHLPWFWSIATLFLFCAIANLYVPLVGLIWFYLVRGLKLNRNGQILALPVLMSVAERVFPMIFDWHSGYTWLWAGFPAFHLADIVGFIGLANVGLFFNALFLMAVCRWREAGSWVTWAVATPVLFALMNVAGWFHAQQWLKPDAQLKFLLVQANIGNQEKLAAEKGWAYRDVVLDRWTQLTARGLAQAPADFAVWPETAFPDLIEDSHLSGLYANKLKQFILTQHTQFLVGGYSRQEGTGRYTNSFFALSSNGEWVDRPYHKTILLAFGEFMPFGDRFPILKSWLPEVGDFGRGPGPTVLNVGELRVGAQICYEGLFDWFTRDLANKGAQIIVNLTNDSWYGKWQQPYEHGYMTFARAVEVRRPLVRSTNTGFSSVALASGEVLPLSPLHEEWFRLYEVPYLTRPQSTLFMGWGYWLGPALLLLAFLTLLSPWMREP